MSGKQIITANPIEASYYFLCGCKRQFRLVKNDADFQCVALITGEKVEQCELDLKNGDGFCRVSLLMEDVEWVTTQMASWVYSARLGDEAALGRML